MTVKFYEAIGKGDFAEIMYRQFSDTVSEDQYFFFKSYTAPWRKPIIIYDINDVAVIQMRKNDNLGRSLKMIGVEERFEGAKSKIEELTKFKLEKKK